MDYKTTSLTKAIKTEEQLVTEIPQLLFGSTEDGLPVFDATAFCEDVGIEGFNHKTFMRVCKPFIEGYVKNLKLNIAKLFYTNPDGHVLIAAELMNLFLSYADPRLLAYFDTILRDALENGVAYSLGFAIQSAAERVPTEILEDIIKQRNDEQQPADD